MKTLKPRIQLQQGKIGAHTTASIRLRGSAWMSIRDKVMSRVNGLCEPCTKAGRITPASDVDHITPLEHGGSNGLHNLQAICRKCHKAKTDQQRQALCAECHQAKSKAEQQ